MACSLCSCFIDAPTCAQNQKKVYGIAKQEDAKVMCTVDANPREVEFSWTPGILANIYKCIGKDIRAYILVH